MLPGSTGRFSITILCTFKFQTIFTCLPKVRANTHVRKHVPIAKQRRRSNLRCPSSFSPSFSQVVQAAIQSRCNTAAAPVRKNNANNARCARHHGEVLLLLCATRRYASRVHSGKASLCVLLPSRLTMVHSSSLTTPLRGQII